MGPQALNERIAVLAKFEQGKLVPVVIRWQGRRYWVQKVNLHHSERQGDDVIHHFAVSTEIGDCVLTYSQKQLFWRLVETNFSE